MAVGDRFQDLLTHEFAEGRLALGVAGGTKAALLARERKQVFVPAIGASDTGEAMGQYPATLEALKRTGDDGPEGAVPESIAVIVYVEEGLSVVCDKLPERRGLGLARTIDWRPAGGGPGVGGLLREGSQSAGHERRALLGRAESQEGAGPPQRVPAVSAKGPPRRVSQRRCRSHAVKGVAQQSDGKRADRWP